VSGRAALLLAVVGAGACGAIADGNDEFSCESLRERVVEIEAEVDEIRTHSVRDVTRLQELETDRETVRLDMTAHDCG